jgi:hypothetical protein
MIFPRRILSGAVSHGETETRSPASPAAARGNTSGAIAGAALAKAIADRAEEYLEKARGISDRQCARLLLVQAHNYLKCAEETEAEQLSARRSFIA